MPHWLQDLVFIINEPSHMTTRRRRNALNATGGRKVETMNKEPHSINKLVITKTCFQQFTMYMRDWIGTLMDSITISLSRSSTWETSICIAEMQIYPSVRACVHACMCACVCGCVCACICMFICVFVCIHIYMPPLPRDGRMIFGGEQRRDQDICL